MSSSDASPRGFPFSRYVVSSFSQLALSFLSPSLQPTKSVRRCSWCAFLSFLKLVFCSARSLPPPAAATRVFVWLGVARGPLPPPFPIFHLREMKRTRKVGSDGGVSALPWRLPFEGGEEAAVSQTELDRVRVCLSVHLRVLVCMRACVCVRAFTREELAGK